jgi:hypothetical protein
MKQSEIWLGVGMMRGLKTFVLALALAVPGVAAAQYQAPANPADPVAQLTEMVALYDEICLGTFPDDGAVARLVEGRAGATRMSRGEVEGFLHDDPGIGWHIAGQTGRFELTIEQSPPYHACAVRAMTANGFADLAPYRAAVDRFENGRDFSHVDPVTMNIGSVATTAAGDTIQNGRRSESLLVFSTTPAEGHRDGGNTAVEIRFVRQIVQQ